MDCVATNENKQGKNDKTHRLAGMNNIKDILRAHCTSGAKKTNTKWEVDMNKREIWLVPNEDSFELGDDNYEVVYRDP